MFDTAFTEFGAVKNYRTFRISITSDELHHILEEMEPPRPYKNKKLLVVLVCACEDRDGLSHCQVISSTIIPLANSTIVSDEAIPVPASSKAAFPTICAMPYFFHDVIGNIIREHSYLEEEYRKAAFAAIIGTGVPALFSYCENRGIESENRNALSSFVNMKDMLPHIVENAIHHNGVGDSPQKLQFLLPSQDIALLERLYVE